MKNKQKKLMTMIITAAVGLASSAFAAEKELYAVSCSLNEEESYVIRVTDGGKKNSLVGEVYYYLHNHLNGSSFGPKVELGSPANRAKFQESKKLAVKNSDGSSIFVFGSNPKSTKQTLDIIDLNDSSVTTVPCNKLPSMK